MRDVVRVRVQVVDDRLVDVPADEIDRRERRQRAAGVRSDELIHERDAVLLGELRDLVQHLEAEAVAGERRRVARSRRPRGRRRRRRKSRTIATTPGSVLACGIELAADDHRRRVEQVDAEEVAPEARRCARAHRGDRQPRRHGRDDRASARCDSSVDQREHLALDRRGPRRPPRRRGPRRRARGARSSSYVPHADRASRATLPFVSCSARARPASAFSRVRARNTVGMPAAANTAPEPDPIAPFAPRTTILRIDLMMRTTPARVVPRSGQDRPHTRVTAHSSTWRCRAMQRAVVRWRARSERDAEAELRGRRRIARSSSDRSSGCARSAATVSSPSPSIVFAQTRSSYVPPEIGFTLFSPPPRRGTAARRSSSTSNVALPVVEVEHVDVDLARPSCAAACARTRRAGRSRARARCGRAGRAAGGTTRRRRRGSARRARSSGCPRSTRTRVPSGQRAQLADVERVVTRRA